MLKFDFAHTKLKERRHILPFQLQVNRAHSKIINRTGEGSDFLGWVDLPVNYDKTEINRMLDKVNDLKQKQVEILLVIGIGGSFLSSKSGIDFVKGYSYTEDKVLFTGTDLSSDHIKIVEEKLKGKKWAIAVISKSGITLEPALAFRHFKNLLQQVQPENTNEYIIAITDAEKGALKELSNSEGYTTFTIPNDIGGRFSGLTPVGLFPMAFAGIDIIKVMDGAAKARDKYLNDSSLKTNDAFRYAVARHFYGLKRWSYHPDRATPSGNNPMHWTLKGSKKYYEEVFVTWTPDLIQTSEWVKQLIGESLSKKGRGILPTSATFTRDLHSLGQTFQEGYKSFFETVIWVEKERNEITITDDLKNIDGLNYLIKNKFSDTNIMTYKAVTASHFSGGTPVMTILLDDKTEETLGYFWYFFFITTAMSGYLLKVNPFDQPGVEVYKKKMFKNFKRELNGNEKNN